MMLQSGLRFHYKIDTSLGLKRHDLQFNKLYTKGDTNHAVSRQPGVGEGGGKDARDGGQMSGPYVTRCICLK